MKMKDGLQLREVAGENMVLPIGCDRDLNMIIALNDTGTFLWEKILKDTDESASAAALLGERAVMVNDDKPFLKITPEGVLACGSPWNGKHRLGNNIMVPLKAICILERGDENRIQKITEKEALPMLLQQSQRPTDPGMLGKYLELLDRLAGSVEFYRLQCNMDPESAKVSFEAMRQ